MKFEISLTKTQHLVTFLEAENHEDAIKLCEEEHSPDAIEIHAVVEIAEPEPPSSPCKGCLFEMSSNFLNCGHPENCGIDSDFWKQPVEKCYTPKLEETLVDLNALFFTGRNCCLCHGHIVSDGETEFCMNCSEMRQV